MPNCELCGTPVDPMTERMAEGLRDLVNWFYSRSEGFQERCSKSKFDNAKQLLEEYERGKE